MMRPRPASDWQAGRNQIVSDQFFPGQLFAVNGYADAHTAITQIVSEGEGAKDDPLDFQDQIAHYYRFGEIWHEKVLTKAGVALEEVGVFEVNEAFAPVPMAWIDETGADPRRVNPLGGAIALGHPLGASGAVLMTRMIHHMRDNGIRYGLQTMCEGGGTANATLVELVN